MSVLFRSALVTVAESVCCGNLQQNTDALPLHVEQRASGMLQRLLLDHWSLHGILNLTVRKRSLGLIHRHAAWLRWFGMMRHCGKHSAACFTWSSGVVPCRLRFGQKVSITSLTSRNTLVVVEAKKLSSVAVEGTVRQRPNSSRRRLDEACIEQRPLVARNVMHSWIVQGKVQVDGKVVSKPGTPVSARAKIDILAVVQQFVCRAGYKMEAALEHFNINVTGMTCLDAGLSTGGFTDCLLQKGAVKVYGVDVGFGQVAEKLRTDPRVVVIDRTNLRYLQMKDLPGGAVPVDLVSLDLSFISVLKVMPVVCELLRPGGVLIVLVKPQFEASRDQVATGGVVRDPAVHQQVVNLVSSGIVALGFTSEGCVESPIKGASGGNTEFLAVFKKH